MNPFQVALCVGAAAVLAVLVRAAWRSCRSETVSGRVEVTAPAAAAAAEEVVGLSSYSRPRVPAVEFFDAEGRVIDYGSRWQGPPPEDSYLGDTHPERFQPLHTIANALVDYLQMTYVVDVWENAGVAADLIRSPALEVVRAVRLSPRDPACASVSVVFTSYPGVAMHAGVLHDFIYPPCGCDACDVSWQAEADRFERQVFAVVEGNYSESVGGGSRPWVEHSFTYPDGASSGRSSYEEFPVERLRRAKTVLHGQPLGWAPWPRRKPASP